MTHHHGVRPNPNTGLREMYGKSFLTVVRRRRSVATASGARLAVLFIGTGQPVVDGTKMSSAPRGELLLVEAPSDFGLDVIGFERHHHGSTDR